MNNAPFPLHGRSQFSDPSAPSVVGVVSTQVDSQPSHCHPRILVTHDHSNSAQLAGFDAVLVRSSNSHAQCGALSAPLPATLDHLTDGDIIRVDPQGGYISVLYRARSDHNSLLLTEQCNCYCVMCSQPPKKVDDSYLVDDALTAIRMMPPTTDTLGLTGGEPTLLGDRLCEVLETAKTHLPQTELHVLTNGRRFADFHFAKSVTSAAPERTLWAVPLASDIPAQHNFIMQSDAGFDEAVRGILNLARLNAAIEIRFVIHKLNADRIYHFARFVATNFPFIDHVALMGLELMGHVKMNMDALWIDPYEYRDELAAGSLHLERCGIPVSIYNSQLCLLPESCWHLAAQSISDWKNIYLPECEGCHARAQCAGFFASSTQRHSQHIKVLSKSKVDELTKTLTGARRDGSNEHEIQEDKFSD